MKTTIRILCLLLAAALLMGAAPGGNTEKKSFHFDADFSSESLEDAIERYLGERLLNGNNVTIGWYELTSGEEWYRGGDTFLEGASTYKLPLSMIYADKINAGELNEESMIGHYELRKALEAMLIDSNNAVGEVLRNRLTRDYAQYRHMLVPYSGLDENELPEKFFKLNVFSPRFMIGTLRTLWENSERYALILELMKQARPNDYFSLYRGDYEVAHKYGSDEGFVCDSGIFYCDRPFLMYVSIHGVGNARFYIGEIARIAMDYAEFLTERDGPAPARESAAETTAAPAETEDCRLAPVGADGVREISDVSELRGIVLAPGDSYRLTADLDLSGKDWTPIPFSGTLDGAGHTLYNLTIRSVGEEIVECRDGNNEPYRAQYAGLFSTAREATVRDLQLKGVLGELESTSSSFLAALAGYAYDLTAENVSVEGRLRLYAKGRMVGVGGIIGFGSGWFRDCSADVELVFEDRNEGIHCEQFLGGLAASGKFEAERCRIDIRGYASVNGFVHTGGMVGMYCGYGLVRDRRMSVTDCTVAGKISFFENNFTRRAYCRGFAGEQVDLVTNLRNDVSGFKRDEHYRYDRILSPEECETPRYTETVTAPDCTHWGRTEHLCEGCGYTWTDSYTPPRHTPGEREIVREAAFGTEGEAVVRCTVCGELLEREILPALNDPQALALDAQTLALERGESRTLTVSFLPEGAESCALVWTSGDEGVARVDENGTVTAVRGGETVVRCASEDGALSAECRVSVRLSFFQRLLGLFRG